MLGQVDTNIFYDNLKNLILREFDGDHEQADAIEGLGLLEEVPVFKLNNPLDTLSHFLSKKLAYGTYIILTYVIEMICEMSLAR